MRAGTDDVGFAAARLVCVQVFQPSKERVTLLRSERSGTGQEDAVGRAAAQPILGRPDATESRHVRLLDQRRDVDRRLVLETQRVERAQAEQRQSAVGGARIEPRRQDVIGAALPGHQLQQLLDAPLLVS